MLGRMNVSDPVCSSSSAPPCREFEPCIDLMMQRSSTHLATSGNRSLTHAPLCPYWPEAPGRLKQIERFARNDFRARKRKRLAMVALQQRLVVERVHLRWPAMHEQEDDPFRARREVGRLHGERIGRCARRPGPAPGPAGRRARARRTRRSTPSADRAATDFWLRYEFQCRFMSVHIDKFVRCQQSFTEALPSLALVALPLPFNAGHE